METRLAARLTGEQQRLEGTNPSCAESSPGFMFAGGHICNDNCILRPIVNRKACFEALSPSLGSRDGRLLHPASDGYFSPFFRNSNTALYFSKSPKGQIYFFTPHPLPVIYARSVFARLPRPRNQDGWAPSCSTAPLRETCTWLTTPGSFLISFLPFNLPSFLPAVLDAL